MSVLVGGRVVPTPWIANLLANLPPWCTYPLGFLPVQYTCPLDTYPWDAYPHPGCLIPGISTPDTYLPDTYPWDIYPLKKTELWYLFKKTFTCENIAFPQPLLRVVKIKVK